MSLVEKHILQIRKIELVYLSLFKTENALCLLFSVIKLVRYKKCKEKKKLDGGMKC